MVQLQAVFSAVTALFNGPLTLGLSSNVSSSIIGEGPYTRSYFYVGGQYFQDATGAFTHQDQIYVEKLTPYGGAKSDDAPPVILIHGQGQTGTNFLNKPDGGRGWASLFIERGYEVYIIDQPHRGRSAWAGEVGGPFSTLLAEQYFTATRRHALWPQAVNHTQWPGTGEMGDPVFDAWYAANVQFDPNQPRQERVGKSAGAALLDRIGRPAIILGHSQGTSLPPLMADARPHLARALILIEAVGPPFQEIVFNVPRGPGDPPPRPWGLTYEPMTYAPPVEDPVADIVTEAHPPEAKDLLGCVLQAADPPPRKLANLVDLPMLLVTAEASYHAQYDHCIFQFLRQAGCSKAQHLDLGRAGVHGNGHFVFLEKNSDQIFDLLETWIASLE